MTVRRGWGFGIHKALDQVGAVIGPLVMVAALAVTGDYTEGFLLLGAPLVGALLVLFFAQAAAPKPEYLEVRKEGSKTSELPGILPYATFIFPGMAGFTNFPIISFHLEARAVTPDATIPLFYASVMVISAAVALLAGRAFDRIGTHTLLTIPVLSTLAIFLAFSLDPGVALARSLARGSGIGIFEAALRVSIAGSTTTGRGIYGTVSAVFGAAWFVGSAMMGILYDISVAYIVVYVIIAEVAALMAYLWMCRSRIVMQIQGGIGDHIP